MDYSNPAVALAFDQVSFWSSRFGALLLDNLEIRPNTTGLDLACGTGFPLLELAQIHGRPSQFVGVDLWEAALKRAAAKLKTYEVRNAAVALADVTAHPFPDRSFDLIVCNLGFNNFDHPAEAFGECARVARRGGRFALTSNVVGHMREFYEIFRSVLADLLMEDCFPRLQENEDHRGAKDRISRMLSDCGFRVERTLEPEFTLRYTNGRALFEHWLTRCGFMEGWRSVIGPEREQHVFVEIEKRLDALASKRGELAMTIPMLYLEAVRE